MTPHSRPTLRALVSVLALVPIAVADWSNIGGNAHRNGIGAGAGPVTPTIRWQGGRSSIIAWHPSIMDGKIFLVRQTGFVPSGVPNEAPVVCQDLVTGAECWFRHIPYNAGEWTTVVFGARNGRVYAGRSGNGSSSNALLYCLDPANGATLWTSAQVIGTGAYDGIAFTDDGDPVVSTHQYVRRINRLNGATLWNTPRSCSVSGDCGPAARNGFVYVDEVAGGGQIITKIDAATGAKLYSTPVMAGFLTQTTPMVGPDGSVYFARIQNNGAVDFMYAWTDTGSAFTLRWQVPHGYTPSGSWAIGPDGSVYLVSPAKTVQRIDAATGALLGESEPISSSPTGATQVHMAVDSLGKVFVSNGEFATGRIWCFTPALATLWSVPVTNINQGGPALASDGTLVVCGVGTDVRAYFAPPANPADLNGDGFVNGADLGMLIGAWGTPGPGDLNGDGIVNGADLGILIGAWTG